jgi:hypothetical protein
MRGLLSLTLLALVALAMIALAMVWPQGLGTRSPAPFGHAPPAIDRRGAPQGAGEAVDPSPLPPPLPR